MALAAAWTIAQSKSVRRTYPSTTVAKTSILDSSQIVSQYSAISATLAFSIVILVSDPFLRRKLAWRNIRNLRQMLKKKTVSIGSSTNSRPLRRTSITLLCSKCQRIPKLRTHVSKEVELIPSLSQYPGHRFTERDTFLTVSSDGNFTLHISSSASPVQRRCQCGIGIYVYGWATTALFLCRIIAAVRSRVGIIQLSDVRVIGVRGGLSKCFRKSFAIALPTLQTHCIL